MKTNSLQNDNANAGQKGSLLRRGHLSGNIDISINSDSPY
jgi:hypothetical protein